MAAAWLALGQRDLLDPSRLDGPPARAARYLVERQRYGPGDPARLEAMVAADPERAGLVIAEAIRLAPTWAAFRYGEGYVRLRAGKYEYAEVSFETACRLAPVHSGLAERIGAAWVREAIERKAPRLLLYAFPRFRAAARLDPDSLRSTARLLAPFLPDVRELAPLVPASPQARGVFGTLLVEAGHAAEALPELGTAIGSGADASLMLALGRARLGTGDVAGAKEAFRAAAAASYTPSDLLRGLYDDFSAAGRREEGRELWEALAADYPKGAHFNLGRYWFEKGEPHYRQSVDEFEQVWRRGADPPTASYLARIEIAWRLYRDARIRLERALLRAPRDADLHYLLALVHHRQGSDVEARREMEKAIEIYPTNDLFHRTLEEWRKR